mmetsp:Transcript_35872/g.74611  ORF Transcript_35872/g.74611 Transcript_35872/m.74611 type:complete len:83 (-) Transcript_35872:277-525(-)
MPFMTLCSMLAGLSFSASSKLLSNTAKGIGANYSRSVWKLRLRRQEMWCCRGAVASFGNFFVLQMCPLSKNHLSPMAVKAIL